MAAAPDRRHYDELETRDPAAREAALFARELEEGLHEAGEHLRLFAELQDLPRYGAKRLRQPCQLLQHAGVGGITALGLPDGRQQ